MKKSSIYPNQSQELAAVFEQAGDNSKIMCIPIDYAKKDHLVMFCNGNGQVLRKPFSVRNSSDGVKYLIEQVIRSCQHRHILPGHVFFGGEDVNSYAENFVNTLRQNGWLVANVNAHEAKSYRQNLKASTDRLDLSGIAATLLNRRADCSSAQSGIYYNLRALMRHRKKLVQVKTAVRNQIHTIVDRLFPGFLDENKSGVAAFSNGCLSLMQERFSAQQIHRQKPSTLIRILKNNKMPKAEWVAEKLQQYASQALSAPDQDIATWQVCLSSHVAHYRFLQDSIEQQTKQIALILAQTQGAFLTSIKGVGIVLAAGVCAEIGDSLTQKSACQLTSYAGIVPKVKQTGGSQGLSLTGRVSKRSNHLLKDYVVQSANQIGRHGPKNLKDDYQRRQIAGQHANFGIGRRFVRMARCMMLTSQIYLPLELRRPGVASNLRGDYFLTVWPELKDKWKKVGALEIAFDKANPLGEWRYIVEQLYGIVLKL